MNNDKNSAASCSTGVPPVRANDAPDELPDIIKRKGARLPHWTREGGAYAIVFRLADSLPQSILKSIIEERKEIPALAEQMKREMTPWEKQRLQELHSERVEKFLQAGYGNCWLKRDDIACMVQDALLHSRGIQYDLLCWCIMPNHVHVVLRPHKNFPLEKILFSWKSYSAKKANKILGRTGVFWSTEYYDHLIRNEAEMVHALRYAWLNPEKAGFKKWKWRGILEEADGTAGSTVEKGNGL